MKTLTILNSLKDKECYLEGKDSTMTNAEFLMIFYSDSKALLLDVSDSRSRLMESIWLLLVLTRTQRLL